MLYIATTNRHKFYRLKTTIRQIFPELEISGIYNMDIKAPAEIGRDELENANIKARYYYSVLKDNVLVEDNGIYFNGLSQMQQLGSRFNNVTPKMSILSEARYWANFLKKNKIKTGHIKYVFILVTKGKYFKEEIEVPFSVYITSSYSSNENILNNFIAPKGSGTVFARMPESTLNYYRKINILPIMDKLIRPHILDVI